LTACEETVDLLEDHGGELVDRTLGSLSGVSVVSLFAERDAGASDRPVIELGRPSRSGDPEVFAVPVALCDEVWSSNPVEDFGSRIEVTDDRGRRDCCSRDACDQALRGGW